MKRTPLVVTATVAGLAGVLAFHTSPSEIQLTPSTGTAGPQAGGTGQGGTTAGQPAASASPSPASSSSKKPAAGGKSKSASGSGTRTVDGPAVNYSYGVLSVSVTVSGHKIVKVGIASLNDGGNFRSESIDQQSIPILEQEAIQAQSSNIQSVSGASYTSAGFETSLQAALRSVGFS
jgi:uncharacterized protein with FMN-binding domain